MDTLRSGQGATARTSAGCELIRLGMPHLDPHGLSELFVLADSGHRHWLALADHLGLPPSRWRDPEGRRIYASFIYTAVSFSAARAAMEDDIAHVSLRSLGAAPPFFATRVDYRIEGAGTASAILLSALIRRAESGGNHAFVRSMLPALHADFGLAEISRLKRRRRAIAEATTGKAELGRTVESVHEVSPAVDFNSADFMYFVSFSRLIKAAEARAGIVVPPRWRELAYWSNVNAFESLSVTADIDRGRARACIRRRDDGGLLASAVAELAHDRHLTGENSGGVTFMGPDYTAVSPFAGQRP